MGILLSTIGGRSTQKRKMLFFRLTVFFLLSILFEGSFQEKTQRDGKVFSLFSIVTFPNSGCASQSVTGSRARNGTCFTATECTEKGGQVSGNCAAGFGVCCLFISSTSGATLSQNCSYIQNPGFPTAYAATTALSFTIAKCATEVCTLRLDFETFTTAGPTGGSDNTAAIDTFQITTNPNQGTIPAISGENSGYHAYIEIGKDAGATATLAFTFGTCTAPCVTQRLWEIKVTQLECTNRSRPPSGCLQYHTGTQGRIETFNYNQATTPVQNQQHLHNQNYNICIRQAAGFNCVRYTPCSDTNSFTISSSIIDDSSLGTNCGLDWIEVAGAMACGNPGISVTKLCGLVLNPLFEAMNAAESAGSAVCDCATPFTVGVFTNAVTMEIKGVTPNRGVCLEYTLY